MMQKIVAVCLFAIGGFGILYQYFDTVDGMAKLKTELTELKKQNAAFELKFDERENATYDLLARQSDTAYIILQMQTRTYHHVAGHDPKTPINGCPECYEIIDAKGDNRYNPGDK